MKNTFVEFSTLIMSSLPIRMANNSIKIQIARNMWFGCQLQLSYYFFKIITSTFFLQCVRYIFCRLSERKSSIYFKSNLSPAFLFLKLISINLHFCGWYIVTIRLNYVYIGCSLISAVIVLLLLCLYCKIWCWLRGFKHDSDMPCSKTNCICGS